MTPPSALRAATSLSRGGIGMTRRRVVTGLDDTERGVLCDATGTDSSGNPTFPSRCNSTLSFLRTHPTDEQRIRQLQGLLPKAQAEYQKAVGK